METTNVEDSKKRGEKMRTGEYNSTGKDRKYTFDTIKACAFVRRRAMPLFWRTPFGRNSTPSRRKANP